MVSQSQNSGCSGMQLACNGIVLVQLKTQLGTVANNCVQQKQRFFKHEFYSYMNVFNTRLIAGISTDTIAGKFLDNEKVSHNKIIIAFPQ